MYLISYMTVQLSVSKVVNQEKPVTWSLLPLVRLLTISCLAYFPQKTASHFFRVSSFDWRLICSILTPNIGHLPWPLKFSTRLFLLIDQRRVFVAHTDYPTFQKSNLSSEQASWLCFLGSWIIPWKRSTFEGQGSKRCP